MSNDIAARIINIHQQIRAYEKKYLRKTNSVSLLAVSKQQSITQLLHAIAANQLAFGENYLQEALPKIEFFAQNYPHLALEWHFIGKIQNNKTRKIASTFAWVHSVDQIKTLQRLNDQRPDNLPPLNICLEINLNHEANKSGIALTEIPDFITYCQTCPRLKLRGLMALPRVTKTFPEQNALFQPLYQTFKQFPALDTLSIGTSNDWEAAIAQGATYIRLGTAIFGARNFSEKNTLK